MPAVHFSEGPPTPPDTPTPSPLVTPASRRIKRSDYLSAKTTPGSTDDYATQMFDPASPKNLQPLPDEAKPLDTSPCRAPVARADGSVVYPELQNAVSLSDTGEFGSPAPTTSTVTVETARNQASHDSENIAELGPGSHKDSHEDGEVNDDEDDEEYDDEDAEEDAEEDDNGDDEEDNDEDRGPRDLTPTPSDDNTGVQSKRLSPYAFLGENELGRVEVLLDASMRIAAWIVYALLAGLSDSAVVLLCSLHMTDLILLPDTLSRKLEASQNKYQSTQSDSKTMSDSQTSCTRAAFTAEQLAETKSRQSSKEFAPHDFMLGNRSILDILNIRGGRCAQLRKSKGSDEHTMCKKFIRPCNRERFNDLLRCMELVQSRASSLQLVIHELSLLAHCSGHHRMGNNRRRYSQWILALSDAKLIPESLALTQLKIEAALGSIPLECAYLKSDGKVCKEKLGGQRVRHCLDTILLISRPAIHRCTRSLNFLLQVLEAYMFCHTHGTRCDGSRFREWDVKLQSILRSRPFQLSAIRQELESWFTSKTAELFRPIRRMRTPRGCFPNHLPFDGPADTYWDSVAKLETTAFTIVKEGSLSRKTQLKTLWDLLGEALSKSYKTPGYVYVFDDPSNPGLVKIGWAKDNYDSRIKEWSFACNRDVRRLFTSAEMATAPLPYAHLLERLIHLVLDQYNVTIYCELCDGNHIEWFRIAADTAITVIKHWYGILRTFAQNTGPSSNRFAIPKKASQPLRPGTTRKSNTRIGNP